jgi:hypothetical protein
MAGQGKTLAKRRKRRGRPPTGEGLTIGVRCHEPLLEALDRWRTAQPDRPLRAAAIRRLIEQALGVGAVKEESAAAEPASLWPMPSENAPPRAPESRTKSR